MNEFEHLACKQILDTLMKRPIAKIFWDSDQEIDNPDIIHPITFKLISEKLQNHVYQSPQDFIDNMNELLANAKKWDPVKSIKPAAAELLTQDFEKAVLVYKPTTIPLSMKIRIAFNEFNEIKSIPISDIEETTSTNNSKPANYLLNQYNRNPNSISREDLVKEIQLLNSTDKLLNLIRFIYKLQPDAILVNKEVTIQLENINPDDYAKIHAYIWKQLQNLSIQTIISKPKSSGSTYEEKYFQ
ncbi:hypothetical protein TVAG_440150 [Trichomonas vaginalis G3]|uniref:Bromo domain-containing protein n=1 Tax=Trichomonas vaginalis (strain ATCC PRA-98 / G3) TaxID=412133 RepID=A2FDL8_TRIV3|nr:bromodomain family [Trichomonas vaginalis G3]EAX96999.1 hypothetical protein TVAG_440150 [Trichomonas vaginalis G3]KAI5487318.1 bromodomain family [Trichomonas vaginalis G3]|eukprot:XP_001309929.1 hypothetical protein [Trichomonas vaginalis G3]